MRIFIVTIIFLLIVSCENQPVNKKESTNNSISFCKQKEKHSSKNDVINSFDDFLKCYSEITIDKIYLIDSLYQRGYKNVGANSVLEEHFKLYFKSIPDKYINNCNYGYRINLSDSLIGVINILYGDTQTYQLDIFNLEGKNIVHFPINKFYGTLITCYAFNSSIFLIGDNLIIKRNCIRLKECNGYIDEAIIHQGEVIDTELKFEIKSNRLKIINEKRKKVKLRIEDNLSFGLKIVN